MKLLEVEGARAPVPHSWRRHCCRQSHRTRSYVLCRGLGERSFTVTAVLGCGTCCQLGCFWCTKTRALGVCWRHFIWLRLHRFMENFSFTGSMYKFYFFTYLLIRFLYFGDREVKRALQVQTQIGLCDSQYPPILNWRNLQHVCAKIVNYVIIFLLYIQTRIRTQKDSFTTVTVMKWCTSAILV